MDFDMQNEAADSPQSEQGKYNHYPLYFKTQPYKCMGYKYSLLENIQVTIKIY